ncbi:MAG: hypothetical protein AAFV80_22805, partial [Bacteroidota bacterium]
QLSEELFTFTPGVNFDHLYMIELLEHLSDPFSLLSEAMNTISDKGTISFTTAINIPQFDHLYNFEVADKKLEQFIHEKGFHLATKVYIPHENLKGLEAANCYYEIKRGPRLV